MTTTEMSKPKEMTPFRKFVDRNIGWIFIIPWVIGFLVFKLYPMVSSLYYSFSNMNFHSNPQITQFGLMNYQLIFSDANIMKAIGVTFKYAFITVPLKLIFALFIAYILNFKIKGVNFFRTAYYIPSILGGSVAIAVLWRALFSTNGVINNIIGIFGGSAINFYGDQNWALFVICLLRVWQFGSAMVLFLAALKGVSQDLYEAASLDGASKWRQFFSITVPLITPVIFYNFVTQLAQAFQEFNGPFIITQGGPLRGTTLMALLVYNYAFKEFKMGLASAVSWVMFIIIMIFTVIAFTSQKHWVYYSDDEGK